LRPEIAIDAVYERRVTQFDDSAELILIHFQLLLLFLLLAFPEFFLLKIKRKFTHSMGAGNLFCWQQHSLRFSIRF
jgi:hypothetical protein